ncbi:hypothetical protein BDZ89DRAFT_1080694 [Hymenopellis radicata]|nr:hypothetical protein BDZ89DRAFT_1080694 [Hymenopellis radicata]
MSTFEDSGLTVADVQSLISAHLHPTILLIFCHGIHTYVFFFALCHIAQRTHSIRKRISFAAIVTFFWCTNTTIVALEWKCVDLLFITHGTTLEAEYNFVERGTLPGGLTISVLRALNVFLADLILIWRCWVLYDGSVKVVLVPSLCLITETVSVCFLFFYAVSVAPSNSTARADWMLVYYSTTVMTNSLCTFLILYRITAVGGVSASLKTYRGIIEILVESAAMYAITYTVLLAVYAHQFYTGEDIIPRVYPQLVSYSITGIAPTLIIARVMAGHSRPDDSWTRPSLPHMQSNMRSIAESLRFACAPGHSTHTGNTTTNIDTEQAQETADGERESDGDVRENKLLAPGDFKPKR